ncbi:MAG: hypothetical protein WCD07_12575 [Burkholderiales bacterium]
MRQKPMPTGTSQSSPAPASYRRIDSLADSLAAIQDVLGTAVHNIRIFDISLEEYGFNTPARVEQLSRFLQQGRNRRVEIILHQTDFLERQAPRFCSLLRTYSHSIEIRKTTHAAQNAMDAFVVADDHSYWHRMHTDHARAVAAINDAQGARSLLLRFAELTEASESGITATTLGL